MVSDNSDRFLEQAEYLEKETFLDWIVEHPNAKDILKRLKGPGNKLLSGPRGSGKTTLMRKAYFDVIDSQEYPAIAAYVNFKTSLKVEAVILSANESTFIFKQWVLHNILIGVIEGLNAKGLAVPPPVECLGEFSKRLINNLKASITVSQAEFSEKDVLTTSSLLELIDKALEKNGIDRAVLLLDDAAHAFSRNQQRDFFEIFRELRAHNISAKAAVYPGVTEYSPNFNIGHDAQEIDAWLRPDDERYLSFMRQIIESRLQTKIGKAVLENQEATELLCYASFGVPRALISMMSHISEAHEESGDKIVQLSKKELMAAIKEWNTSCLSLFSGMSTKLRRYSNFIIVGEEAFQRAVELIKAYNREKEPDKKAVSFAVKRPIEPELQRVLGFLQYAGLIAQNGTVSRGVKGVFERYTVHYAALITSNAFFGDSRTINQSDLVVALRTRHPHEFKRTTDDDLLGANYKSRCKLDLPPCPNCNEPRFMESAAYCFKCASPLPSVSTYQEALNSPISDLGLTEWRVQMIERDSSIRYVKDVLLDHEHKALKGVWRIGPRWAERIHRLAEEHIS